MPLKTRCPYQSCLQVFEASAAEAICPACQQRFSARPLEVLLRLDMQAKQQLPKEQLATSESITRAFGSTTARKPALIGIVEDVRSLWNVGSIYRSADGAGFALLLLTGITGTPPRKQIEKTSLGAEQVVPWLYAPSFIELAGLLKSHGCFLLGLEHTRNRPGIADSVPLAGALEQGRISQPVCLIVGNEVSGLSLETLLGCDLICDLPMRGSKESLNVAVAFGIAAYLLAERL